MRIKKNKMKTIVLIFALAMLYSGGYAQDETIAASAQKTEEVVQAPQVEPSEGKVVEEAKVEKEVLVEGTIESKPEQNETVSAVEVKAPELVNKESKVKTDSEAEKEGDVDIVIASEKEQGDKKEEISAEIETDRRKEDETNSADSTNPIDEAVNEPIEQAEEATEVVINSLGETILFRFLQDFAFLEDAAKILDNGENKIFTVTDVDTATVLSYTSSVEAIQSLSFVTLHKKLYAKLIELAQKENFPVADLDPRAADEKDCWAYFVKNNPNLSDLFSLFIDSTFKKDFCENNFNATKQMEVITKNSNSILEEKLDLEVLELVFIDKLKKYEEFIDKNKEILQRVESIVNNNFKIANDIGEKKCTAYRNEEYCSIPATRSIKSLRELMAYVQKM